MDGVPSLRIEKVLHRKKILEKHLNKILCTTTHLQVWKQRQQLRAQALLLSVGYRTLSPTITTTPKAHVRNTGEENTY